MTTSLIPALALDDGSDLVAAVPHLLGFHPEDSIVVVTLVTDEGIRVGPVIRSDLPSARLRGDTVRRLVELATSEDAHDALALVVGGGQASPPRALPHRGLIQALERAFEAKGISLCHAQWVPAIEEGRTWWCYEDPECSGLVPDPDTSAFATAMTVAGVVKYPTREALAASLSPDAPEALARRAALLDEAADAPDTDCVPDAFRRDMALIRSAMARFHPAEPEPPFKSTVDEPALVPSRPAASPAPPAPPVAPPRTPPRDAPSTPSSGSHADDQPYPPSDFHAGDQPHPPSDSSPTASRSPSPASSPGIPSSPPPDSSSGASSSPVSASSPVVPRHPAASALPPVDPRDSPPDSSPAVSQRPSPASSSAVPSSPPSDSSPVVSERSSPDSSPVVAQGSSSGSSPVGSSGSAPGSSPGAPPGASSDPSPGSFPATSTETPRPSPTPPPHPADPRRAPSPESTRAAPTPLFDDHQLIALAVALGHSDVRGECLTLAFGDQAPAAERLWTHLTRSLPAPERAEPACLLAVTAYLRGDGPLARIALDIALEAHPGHALAALFRAAVGHGITPSELRRILERASESPPT